MQNIPLDHDEHITLASYRHWINLVPPIVSSAVLLIAAVAVAYLSGRYHGKIGTLEFPRVIPVLIALILAVFAGGLTALALWVYHRNQLILTNKHLIKVEQDGLFARRISQLSLGRVQDVNGSRRGLIATILNFGNVEVQTAGEQEEFIFVQMPDPAGLADRLVKAHDAFADADDGTEAGASAVPVTPPASAPLVTVMPPAVSDPVASEELPEKRVSTSVADFGAQEEQGSPAPIPQPPVEETPPTLPAAAPLAENQTVQIPPPDAS